MKNFTIKRGKIKTGCGFTLVETLIAVAILTLAVAGPLFTASRAIVAAQSARDQLIASYLAQEGIEYIRAMRDNAYLTAYQAGGSGISGTAWSSFLVGINSCRTPSTCTFDPMQASAPSSCSNCSPLYLLTTPAYSQQNLTGSKETPFIRTIQTRAISSTEELITGTVKWNFHGIPYTVTVTDHLTPWQ